MANINGNEIYFGIFGQIEKAGIAVATAVMQIDGINLARVGTATQVEFPENQSENAEV